MMSVMKNETDLIRKVQLHVVELKVSEKWMQKLKMKLMRMMG